MVKVSVEKTPAYDLAQMCQAVEKHFACFQLEKRLSPASRVAIKPNLLMKRTPDQATTTHPVLVEAVILTLQKLGVSRITLIDSPGGLYNRQATYFIQKANEFKSSIWIEVEDRRINAKSLLGVLSMGITKGTRISLIAEGPDEEEAVNTLTEMLAKEIF